jgi:hypothetical protein
MLLPTQYKTRPIPKTQREASRKLTVNFSHLITYELGYELEMDQSISFIEALLGDG